jgi:hypothetical protein
VFGTKESKADFPKERWGRLLIGLRILPGISLNE